MHMKASGVSDWLRPVVGKRDHRKLVRDDHYLVLRPGPNLVLRPGPNFDWLMGNPAVGQPIPSEQDPAGGGRREADDRAERG
jgi:hypothetical protein